VRPDQWRRSRRRKNRFFAFWGGREKKFSYVLVEYWTRHGNHLGFYDVYSVTLHVLGTPGSRWQSKVNSEPFSVLKSAFSLMLCRGLIYDLFDA
jgi:hypothetical protein